jgi:hypothetical protein
MDIKCISLLEFFLGSFCYFYRVVLKTIHLLQVHFMYKKILLFIIVLPIVAKGFAQHHTQPSILTCINIVNKKGQSLIVANDNTVEVLTFPDLNRMGGSFDDIKDFAELLEKDERTDNWFFNYYAGKPPTIATPFSNKCYMLSGPIRELLVTLPDVGEKETMRIIFLNNISKTNKDRITTYCIDPIPFKIGTYEIDCAKFSQVKDTIYNNTIPIRLYTVKNKLTQRKKITIPQKQFFNYRVDGFTFEKDGSFTFQGHEGTRGKGTYKLTKNTLTLHYTNAKPIYKAEDSLPTEAGFKAILVDSTIAETYTIKCTAVDKNTEPISFASMYKKGTKSGVTTDRNGVYTLNFRATDFPMVLTISAIGYGSKDILFAKPGTYHLQYIMDNHYLSYIDSGTIQKGVFTDYTKDYMGIYWLAPNEIFQFNNQEQMENRRLYDHKRIPKVIVFAD